MNLDPKEQWKRTDQENDLGNAPNRPEWTIENHKEQEGITTKKNHSESTQTAGKHSNRSNNIRMITKHQITKKATPKSPNYLTKALKIMMMERIKLIKSQMMEL